MKSNEIPTGDPGSLVELVVLAVKERAARCRLVASGRSVTLRASRLREMVPGEIAVVKPRKEWTWAGHPYLAGEIESLRFDVDALGPDSNGLLPWGYLDNRPFLRCMHGFGLCLWRLERFDEAERIFERILWLNPSDNQGVRFLIDYVRARKTWADDYE